MPSDTEDSKASATGKMANLRLDGLGQLNNQVGINLRFFYTSLKYLYTYEKGIWTSM